MAGWLRIHGHTRMPWRSAAFALMELARESGASVLDAKRLSNLQVVLTLEADRGDVERLIPLLEEAGVSVAPVELPEGDGPWTGVMGIQLIHDEDSVRDVIPGVPG